MKFTDFQHILSPERLNRYVVACGNDTRKAMSLYRLNLNLSQEVFTLLSCFEVSLRNAIDRELTARYGVDWLRDSVANGGIFDIASCRDSARIISKAYNRLNRNGEYTHYKLLAEMEFGVWCLEIYVCQSTVQSHRANTSTDISEQASFISRDTI
ncbi:MAG: hypothetical protein K2H50_03940 [Paramuribaculum sp.]|nr:hypothetical protein [Paramuribaculum sp.]